jgi:hypothetical protein
LLDDLPGGDSGGGQPVPIPNTEVKPASADGTWGATPWESRSLPGIKGDEGRRCRPSCASGRPPPNDVRGWVRRRSRDAADQMECVTWQTARAARTGDERHPGPPAAAPAGVEAVAVPAGAVRDRTVASPARERRTAGAGVGTDARAAGTAPGATVTRIAPRAAGASRNVDRMPGVAPARVAEAVGASVAATSPSPPAETFLAGYGKRSPVRRPRTGASPPSSS